MPRLQLTKKNIDKLPFTADGQIDYWDTELKGLGLRVGRDSKTFFVKVDILDPMSKKYRTVKGKIGRYEEFTPEQARTKAPEVMKLLREGKPADGETIPTFRHLFERYMREKPMAPGTAYQYNVHVPSKFSSWFDLLLPDLEKVIKPAVVIERYQQVMEGNGPGAAYNAFKCLQSVINYGSILYPGYITRNPVKTISEAKLWVQRSAREDRLEGEQFKVFAEGLLRFSHIHRDCFLFALYQGLRPNEAQSLEWEDVCLERGTVFISHEAPEEKTRRRKEQGKLHRLVSQRDRKRKSKESYVIPLCRQSLDILKKREMAKKSGNPCVFPSECRRTKRGHVVLRSEQLRDRTGLEITPHGLRRTFITTGEKLKLRREDINLLTGHADASVTGKHYAMVSVEDLRPVAQAIANEIERQLNGNAGKIIHFPAVNAS